MLARLVALPLRNRLVVAFFVLVLAALGVRSMQRLPIDAVPDVTNVQVQVLTNAPALGPTEVERIVTIPVETAMSGLPRIEEIRSISRFGLSAVTVVFEEGTNIYFARQLVQERLTAARDAIAEGQGTPEMAPVSTGLGEVFQFEVRGEPMCPEGGPDTDLCWTPMELRTLLDWYVAPRLRWVAGVVEVNSMGGYLKTYEVQVDPSRLAALALPLSRVIEALDANNANSGGAYLVRAGEQRLIRGEALVRSAVDIERIVVANRDGTPILVRDVATVEIAPMVRQGAVTRDGRGEAVTGIVMMLMGANAREVVRDVQAEVDKLAPTLPAGVTIDVFYDRADLVGRTIRTVATNLLEGGALVIVVLLLLLGNLRGGLIVASVIPLSMLGAFIAMEAGGISGNLMSLGAIDFGIIVDGTVVVVERVVSAVAARRSAGADTRETVRAATAEVAQPVVFGVLIITVVYLPVLSLGGIEGKLFRPMAYTVMFALLTSLILSITYAPALASVVFRRGVTHKEPRLVRWIRAGYEPVLRVAVRHRVVTLLLAGGALVSSASLVPTLGAEFIPTLEEGAVALQAARLPSVALEESVDSTTRIEQALLDHFPDEVESIVSKTGRPEIATDPMGVDLSDVYVFLHPIERWTAASDKADLVAQMRAVLEDEIPGQAFAFSQPIELRTNELISGFRSDVAVAIYGDDLATLRRLADEVAVSLSRVEGAVDVRAEPTAGLPVARIQVDRERLARYGIDAREVLDAVAAVGGLAVGEVFEGQRRFRLQVRFAPGQRETLDELARIPVADRAGVLIPLGEVTTIVVERGPAQISRDRLRRRITVEANVAGRDLSGFVADAQARIGEEVKLPAGVWVEWRGQFENLADATARLAVAVPVALLLIFTLLYFSSGSLRTSAIIFLNVPFAATGGVIALVLGGMPFSISAGVGFIAVFGIAVLNGLVLAARFGALVREGRTRADAAVEAASSRTRAVLMTALTDAIGFLPMALATTAGAEVQRPLATVVVGGVTTSTLLTLLVLPAAFALFGPRPEDSRDE